MTPEVAFAGPLPLAMVLEKIDLGIVGVSPSAELVVYSNPKARELLGGDVDADMVAELFGSRLRGARTSIASFLIGDWVRVGEHCVGFSVYELPDGSQWIILRDVTDKLRLQRVAEGTTVATNLGYAFAGLAHELGNPINSVKMAATVLRENMTTFSAEKQHEYLTEIVSETVRMQEILRLMQGFIGLGELDLEPLDLADECRKLVSLVGRDTTRKGIAIVSAFAARGPVVARADATALRQVLLNLLTNATEAVSDRDMPQITLDVAYGEGAAHVRVHDNGRGISAGEKERLFFPFYSTRPGGMGFGLVIVKKLVSAMGGTIEVTSEPGVGTSFEVTLPLAEAG